MRRIAKYIVLVALIMGMSIPCLAAQEYKQTYLVNGNTIECNVIIKNNVTYVSFGQLSKVLGVYTHINLSPSGETPGQIGVAKSKQAIDDYNYDIFYEVYANNIMDVSASTVTGAAKASLEKNLPFEQNGKFYLPLKAIAQAYKINLTYVKKDDNTSQLKKSLQINSKNVKSFFNLSYNQIVTKYGNSSETINLEGGDGIKPSGLDIYFSINNSKVSSISLTPDSKSSIFGIKTGMSLSEVEKVMGKCKNAYDNIAMYTVSGYDIWLNFSGNFSKVTYTMIKKSDY